ncbi:MAG: ATP-binding protein [Propionibacteriaceae bacterium]|nr:ATP-binding protein [Propionibacteriaceae bacterium]
MTWLFSWLGLVPHPLSWDSVRNGSLVVTVVVLALEVFGVIVPVQGLGHLMARWSWQEVTYYLRMPGLRAVGIYLLLTVFFMVAAQFIPRFIDQPQQPTHVWNVSSAVLLVLVGAVGLLFRGERSPWLTAARGLYGWYDPKRDSPAHILKPERGPDPFQRNYYAIGVGDNRQGEATPRRWTVGDLLTWDPRQGGPRVILVSGGAGMGKTRLADEIEKALVRNKIGYLRLKGVRDHQSNGPSHNDRYSLASPLVDDTGQTAVQVAIDFWRRRPCVIFVDHVLARPQEDIRKNLRDAIEHASDTAGAYPITLLLVDRSADGMANLAQVLAKEEGCGKGDIWHVDLQRSHGLTAAEVSDLYTAAYEFYAKQVSLAKHSRSGDHLIGVRKYLRQVRNEQDMARPIDMNVRALAAVLNRKYGVEVTSKSLLKIDDVFETLLHHERRHWNNAVDFMCRLFPQANAELTSPDSDLFIQTRIARFMTLRALAFQEGASDDDAPIPQWGIEWIVSCVDPGFVYSVDQWKQALHWLYPSDSEGGIGSLWPEELADYLIDQQFSISPMVRDGSEDEFMERVLTTVPDLQTALRIAIRLVRRALAKKAHVTLVDAWDTWLSTGMRNLTISAEEAEDAWGTMAASGRPGVLSRVLAVLAEKWSHTGEIPDGHTWGGIRGWVPGRAISWIEDVGVGEGRHSPYERLGDQTAVDSFFSVSREGEEVRFGPWRWTVIHQAHDEALLLSTYIVGWGSYHSCLDQVTWEQSSIRAELNQFFENSEEFQAVASCVLTDVARATRREWECVDGLKGHLVLPQCDGTDGALYLLDDTELCDWVYRVPIDSVDPSVRHRAQACAMGETSPAPWWLRSPGGLPVYAGGVDTDGNRRSNAVVARLGVRPALWVRVNPSSDIDESQSRSVGSSEHGDFPVIVMPMDDIEQSWTDMTDMDRSPEADAIRRRLASRAHDER